VSAGNSGELSTPFLMHIFFTRQLIGSNHVVVKDRQKDTGFGKKLVQHLPFFEFKKKKSEKSKKKKTYIMAMHMSFLKLNSTILYFL
jgi:hypothetical protein